jgi:hypothetical protein
LLRRSIERSGRVSLFLLGSSVECET